MFCILECCSNYWIPNNIKGNVYVSIALEKILFRFCFQELDSRLKSQLIGQPLVYDLILKSISSHVSNPNPSKSLVLSLHGSTGTGMCYKSYMLCLSSS